MRVQNKHSSHKRVSVVCNLNKQLDCIKLVGTCNNFRKVLSGECSPKSFTSPCCTGICLNGCKKDWHIHAWGKGEDIHQMTGRELGLGLRKAKIIWIFCRLYKLSLGMMETKLWMRVPLSKWKSTSLLNYSCLVIHRHVQIKKKLRIMDSLNVHDITPF